jgi:hypothetical protein
MPIRIKRLNESVDQIESLEDALVELTDSHWIKIVQLVHDSAFVVSANKSKPFPVVRLLVKLTKHTYQKQIQGNVYKPEDLKSFDASHKEKMEILNLVEEALDRSNINHTNLLISIIHASDVLDFLGIDYDDYNDHGDLRHLDLDKDYFMAFYIEYIKI